MAVRSREWPGCGGSGDPVDFLLTKGLISHETAQLAREASGDSIAWLLTTGHITEREATMASAHAKGIPYVDLDRAMALFEAYHLPAARAWEIGALPLMFVMDLLFVALRDPFDAVAVRTVARLTGKEVQPIATPPGQLDEALNALFVEPDLYFGNTMVRSGAEVLVRKGLLSQEQLRSVESSEDPI